MMLKVGKYGAKVQSFNKHNPRGLLKRLISTYGMDDEWLLFTKFYEQITNKKFEPYLISALEYWFTNNLGSLKNTPKTTTPVVVNISEHVSKKVDVGAIKKNQVAMVTKGVKQLTAKIEQEAAKKARIILMDMILPTGKRLGDSTGAECISCGGWLKSVGDKIGPDAIVEASITEDELQKTYEVS
jgi:hypothetical protein